MEINTREGAYLWILHRGLSLLRDWTNHKKDYHIAILEAEHLHNIPSLLNETNELRHKYYFDKERIAYIEGLKRIDCAEYRETMLRTYSEAWQTLERFAK
ncbi:MULTISPECIES: hypothetical protein [unclassified Lentimonas]|nr:MULTISPECIES: hypothetical protein [unclassified Lentimonas]